VSATSTATGWGSVARFLHWATAAALAVQAGTVGYIWTIDDIARRFDAAQMHKSWGAVCFSSSCP
jgi:cytochrome b561